MIAVRATYRLQFHAGFGFDDARKIAPYLAKLGISHVYASPYLKARPGSTHGYDIVDHQALNPELGDREAFERMTSAFRNAGLGQILDFVPNHMGVGGADNPLWLDVLEWGPNAAHAGWFDIDWDPDRRYLHDKLLVPFLGEQYGVELANGNLKLRFDATAGDFAFWAYETHKLPVCPLQYVRILGDAHPALERIGDAFSGLPDWRPQVVMRAHQLKAELAALVASDVGAAAAVEQRVAQLNSDVQALDGLIQEQYWRAAHFRVAGDDINYRRFFNINDLAGMRMELPEVFDHAHALVFRLLRDGVLDGLRIDHIDGLLDPKAYLQRLRTSIDRPFYLVVEKILAPHESLPEDWPVDGTTGYDFTNQVLGILIKPSAEAAFTQTYADFTTVTDAFSSVVYDCKIRIMDNEMASELNVLARDISRTARQNPRTADFTRNLISRAVKQIIACFPVYRTYIDTVGQPSDADRRDLDWAMAQARRIDSEIDPSVFDFLAELLSGDLVATPRSGFSRQAVLRCAMKLQQYSGPVMAKGLEDTAFYRYNRFVALNEVGGAPDRFGTPLSAFHRANAHRAQHWPNAMLGTSTHDTKRGEDTRARLAALSDLPEEWSRQVQTWSRVLRARRGDVEGTAPPDRNDEYLFYQLLLGAWPAEWFVQPPDDAALTVFADRLKAAMEKSVREAKRHSTWAAPNAAYEGALASFIQDALHPTRSATFLSAFLPFAERVARLGVQNSLVQCVLKLTVPGVPDLYQGAELWDLSLVDPDNRRPVDFVRREAALEQIVADLSRDRPRTLRNALVQWTDGTVKLAITHTLLELRRAMPALFATGDYEPITIEGPRADAVCAFTRTLDAQRILVLASRFPGAIETSWVGHTAPVAGEWRDCFSGRRCSGPVSLAEAFADLPVAVLLQQA
jgi:(1->4)-alpha-D-glucan 1-alpha-D-glucosylmutase